MLLYDDINRKGFEGDLVLNGFAEFIRNLLVCKDEKAAVLLEVVESFKDLYMKTAKKTSPALLISTLNILSEAELNYKAARNKRLHVELAIIKLCYLQQAIELTETNSGLSKKKLIDSALALKVTPIKLFSNLPASQEQLLPVASKSNSKQSEAKLLIETGAIQPPLVKEDSPAYNQTQPLNSEPSHTNTKLTALDKIRKQYKNNGNNGNSDSIHPLEEHSLKQAWAEYILKLKEEKNSAAQSFELAILRIKDENSFEAVTANNIEQKFIEQDRNRLFTFLQHRLKNRLLQFNVIIDENKTDRPEIKISLTAKEQFQKMSEEYPLVKELKERLKLDLDY
jgi:DNA polymerase-3 subunit gamma/tau